MEPSDFNDIIKCSTKETYQVIHANLTIKDVNFDTNMIKGNVKYDITLMDDYKGKICISAASKRCKITSICSKINSKQKYTPLVFRKIKNTIKNDLLSQYLATDPHTDVNTCRYSDTDEKKSNNILPVSKLRSSISVYRELFGDIKVIANADLAIKNEKGQSIIRLKIFFEYKINDGVKSGCDYYEKIFVSPHCGRFPCGGSNFCEWFPCFNKSYHSCPWKIKIKTNSQSQAIVSGFLKQAAIDSNKSIIYEYVIPHCTKPGNIGVVIGEINKVTFDDSNHNIYNRVEVYSPDCYISIAKESVFQISNFIKFFEEMLEFKYPVEKFKIIFTDICVKKPLVFFGMVILNTCHLCPSNAMLQIYINYQLYSMFIADSLFGCYFTPRLLTDVWLFIGSILETVVAHYSAYLGGSEAKNYLFKSYMDMLLKNTDSNYLGKDFMLCPIIEYLNDIKIHQFTKSKIKKDIFDLYREWLNSSHLDIISSKECWKNFCARSWFVIRFLAAHQTKNTLKIFFKQKFLQNTKEFGSGCLIIDSQEFLQFFVAVKGVDEKETHYIGSELLKRNKLLNLSMANLYNKKKHSVEFYLASVDDNLKIDSKMLPSSIKVFLKEYRSEDIHTIELEPSTGMSSLLPGKICLKGETSCRGGKIRRSYKRRFIGNDIQTNNDPSKQYSLEHMVDDCVMFVVPDPTFCDVYGHIRMLQSEFAWHKQLENSHDPLFQMIAANELKHFPSLDTLKSLSTIIKSRGCYYGVRLEAFKSLITVLNNFVPYERCNILREFYPSEIYKAAFGVKYDQELSQPLIFSSLSEFFLRIKIIKSMKNINPPRNTSADIECLLNTKNMLYRIWKCRSNISNVYADCCYRSEILKTLGCLLLTLKLKGIIVTKYVELLLNESIDALNEEVVKPSYHYCISKASLKCIYYINQCECINGCNQLFLRYSQCGINDNIRCEAVKCLIKSLKNVNNFTTQTFDTIIDIIMYDPSLVIKQIVFSTLAKYPPLKCIEANEFINRDYIISQFNKIFYYYYIFNGGIEWSRASWDYFERIYRSLFGDPPEIVYPSSSVLVLSKSLVQKSIENYESRKNSDLHHYPVSASTAKVVKTIDDGNKIKIVFKLTNHED